VSHLQSVLEDPAWREAYNASLPLMTEHATELSQNKNLQQAYQQIADNMPQDATPSMQMLVDQELRDFRLAGVALPDKEKARYKALKQELAATQAKFDQNVQDATDAWQLHTTEETQVAGLPEQVVERARHEDRPRAMQYLERIAADFVPLRGDRSGVDDPALLGGLARAAWEPMPRADNI